MDAIDAKGDALAALSVLGVKPESVQVVAEAPGWYHPGRSGSLRQGRAVLATFGELHPRVRELFDLAAPVAVFELDLDAVPMPKARAGKARPDAGADALPAGRPRLRLRRRWTRSAPATSSTPCAGSTAG